MQNIGNFFEDIKSIIYAEKGKDWTEVTGGIPESGHTTTIMIT